MNNVNYDQDEGKMRRWNRPLIVERAVSELQGMSTAIIYDGVVENDEIIMLYKWLTLYREESNEWPMKELKALIERICEDNIVTSKERVELFAFLKDFAVGADQEPVVGGIYDDAPIIFPQRIFMFTGKLCFGPRKKAQEAVITHGGELATSSAVTRKLNYLVCGDLGNVNYRQSRFGNKIAGALELREQGHRELHIVREATFVDAVMKIGG